MKGCVHYYYGDGKGKTTAALGLALRASNHNRVLYCQFLKNNQTNELEVLKKVDNIDVFVLNWNYPFTFLMSDQQKEESQAKLIDYFGNIEKIVDCNPYQVVILDEIGDAVSLNYLKIDRLRHFLKNRPVGVEVVMTGHQKMEELEALIDYQTNFVKEAHPFDKGMKARSGIEY